MKKTSELCHFPLHCGVLTSEFCIWALVLHNAQQACILRSFLYITAGFRNWNKFNLQTTKTKIYFISQRRQSFGSGGWMPDMKLIRSFSMLQIYLLQAFDAYVFATYSYPTQQIKMSHLSERSELREASTFEAYTSVYAVAGLSGLKLFTVVCCVPAAGPRETTCTLFIVIRIKIFKEFCCFVG